VTAFGKKLDDIYRSLGNSGLLFMMFIAALIMNVVFSLHMSLPWLPDEFHTAAWSAYFSGFGELPLIDGGWSGWLTGIIYTPFYYLIDNPVIRYRCMLILNSVLAAFIPILTYKITASLGLQKAWQRTLCAVVAGIGTAVFAHTKFIGTGTLCVFLPLLLFYLFTRCIDVKNRAIRFFLSVFAALILSFAPAADLRLWMLVPAFILLVLYSKYILCVKSVSLFGFFPALTVFTALQLYVSERLMGEFFARGTESFPFIGQLYHFAVSTWGIGVLGIVLCIAAFRQKNSPLKGFAFFTLIYNAFMLFSDSASLLLVLFALCFIFIHGLEFRQLMCSAIALGAVFAPAHASAALEEVSAVFCVIALLFVLVSCAERYRSHIITFSLSLAFLYSGLNLALFYLPQQSEKAELENAAALTISEYIYNSADAPPTYILDADDLAPILQFLNRNTIIKTADVSDELPEDCFVIMFNENNELTFTAVGEKAEAFALSQED
jgi:hypothetical protein